MSDEQPATPPRLVLDCLSVFVATGFFLSLAPLVVFRSLPFFRRFQTEKWSGCGLMGSALGVATYALLPERWASSAWVLLAATLVAVAVSARAEKVLGRHDDTRIVIDEWIGAWLAATGVPHGWGLPLVAAFVLFRVFDVWKGPFAPLQRLPGGWGIALDDVAAGGAAAVLFRIFPLLTLA